MSVKWNFPMEYNNYSAFCSRLNEGYLNNSSDYDDTHVMLIPLSEKIYADFYFTDQNRIRCNFFSSDTGEELTFIERSFDTSLKAFKNAYYDYAKRSATL